MGISVYFGWGLLFPACFSLIYSLAAFHIRELFGYARKHTTMEYLLSSLPFFFLCILWGMVNIPLPLVYILVFLEKYVRFFHSRENRAKESFLMNLAHLSTMALQMILVGVCSLKTGLPMNSLLDSPLFRIFAIVFMLAENILLVYLLPHWDTVVGVLRTQADSEEVRPFLIFLWFCNAFLFLDSVLCIVKIDWKLLPLFLIGSTVLLEFCLIQFIRNLYTILKVHYLEDEYCRLAEKLEQQNRTAAELRSKWALDSMTGIFSRQYILEQMKDLLSMKMAFSFVFIDLDHLKQVNDRKGHHAGDLYLIRFTEEFRSYLRKSDTFARVGGDEFAVLLPGCRQDTAMKRLDDIQLHMSQDLNPPISFSYGVVHILENSEEHVEQIFHRADQAMYKNKKQRTG